ncbi:hypothetical protein ALC57_04760 [Trachymyrmex cornetzi]|uniref:Uncharacterized protein n=1 Tax=Trachymyrmex cornetzi TaxID=471704 RepID=A0A195EDU6_9HYME|nr:hypothetical protein ALC57_04760 [Trachymyrmex cornetzi]
MAAKDYEGTATAAVSNFQRYYYFNPLSLRQGAAEQSDNDLSSAIEPPIRRGAAGEELNCEVQQKQSRADDIPTITIPARSKTNIVAAICLIPRCAHLY